jgi:hypothetical protein
MRALRRRIRLAVVTGVAACLAAAGGRPPAAGSTAENLLRAFLRSYLNTPSSEDDKTTCYSAAFVDLNGDGTPEAVVYVTGRGWCGSGGCTTLILARTGSSFRLVTKVTITRPPIRVLANASSGWRDIGVWVRGGGITPGYEADLRFDGKAYPGNPSTPPARRAPVGAAGQVVISSSQEGTPLYR